MNQFQRALKMNPVRLMKKIFCFEEIYTIAYRNRDGHTLLDSELLSFDRIPFDENYWYADPILVSRNGKEYLLMESFDMRTQLGSIACAEFDASGKLSAPRVIIQEAYHMSFPMVFTWNDNLYMIPETCENRSLNLYRCEGDMYRWHLVKSFPVEEELVDTVAVSCREDSVELITAAIHKTHMRKFAWRKYRLFRDGADCCLEADAAFNANQDFDYGFRMAGSLIAEQGTRILPTQVSTDVDYGLYLNLNDFSGGDITDLPVLKKVMVNNIQLPDVRQKDHIGVHSYGLSDKVEVVDMRYFRFLPRSRMRKIWNKGRKLLCMR
jgi:hypothetical protein